MNQFILALLSGILFAISWPTYGFPIFIFIAFVPLLIAEDTIAHSNTKYKGAKIFGLSYLSFLIWNVFTTGWLYYADLIGMLFANLVNSLLMTFVFWLYHITKRNGRLNHSLIFFASAWILFEYLHLHWDFSWPWLNLGHVFSENIHWIQWYEYTGTFGGTLWVMAVNLLIFINLKNKPLTQKSQLQLAGKSAIAIGLPIVISLWIYHTYTPEVISKKEVILLQPNIDPYTEKYNYDNNYMSQLLLEMADKQVSDKTQYLIAPETVLAENLPYSEFLKSKAFSNLINYTNKHPNLHILGGLDSYNLIFNPNNINQYSNKIREGIWGNFYNLAFIINQNYYDTYYKSKLVVGVENLPYKSVIEPLLGNIMLDMGGTISTKTIQDERKVFGTTSRVAPIICYESVYGEYVTDYVKKGANFLAIITNDAWWRETQGHKQHLSLARLRAIETRKDIARSANTGISAFINSKGEIVSQTKYNEKAVLKGEVALNNTQTFYVKFGDYIAKIALLIFGLSIINILFFKNKLSLKTNSYEK